MTTTISVTACCNETQYVEVRKHETSGVSFEYDKVISRDTLESGNAMNICIWGDQYVVVRELTKGE